MNPRILILSASVGAGHMRAAQAVELALRERGAQATLRNLDVLTLTNVAFKRLYAQTYLDLVDHAPHLFGYLYDRMDQPTQPLDEIGIRFRRMVENANLKKLLDCLKEGWDLVIHTHFLPAEIMADLRRQKKLNSPHFIVTTDFDAHRMWVYSPCEQYFAATEESAINLAAMGVPREKIIVSGIPIHPVFSRPKPRAECAARQGLLPDRVTVLQLAGGFGVGPMETIYRSILAVEKPLQVAVVAGRNAAAKKKLEAIEVPARHRALVLGFTDQIDELMAASDLVVSKPGGLTTSETLARGAAMLIVNPIPGQKARNSDLLLEAGAALKVNSLAVLTHKLSRLLENPAKLESLQRQARALAKPQAAFQVADRALAFLAAR